MDKIDSFIAGMKKVLHRLDEIFHIAIAFLLDGLVFFMMFYTVTYFKAFTSETVLFRDCSASLRKGRGMSD
jgi:hypothetical protein